MQILRGVGAVTTCVALACTGWSCSPSAPSTSGVPVASLIVAGTPPTIGTSSQFAAIATRSDGTSQAVTSQAAWRSSNTPVATVTSGGLVTAVSRGFVEIEATYGDRSGSLAFTVTAAVTFTLRGTVTEAGTAAGVPSATVTVKGASTVTRSAVTDSAGRYAVSGITAGDVDVTAEAPSFVRVTRSTRILGDTTLDFALTRVTPCPTIGFDDLQINGRAFNDYTACGFAITPTTTNWTVS